MLGLPALLSTSPSPDATVGKSHKLLCDFNAQHEVWARLATNNREWALVRIHLVLNTYWLYILGSILHIMSIYEEGRLSSALYVWKQLPAEFLIRGSQKNLHDPAPARPVLPGRKANVTGSLETVILQLVRLLRLLKSYL